MFYYMYEVRNLVNGKIYVGVHKTKNLDDGYMGSGKVIRSAIDKYGIENFVKIIIEHFDCASSMFAKEKEVVNEEFLSRPDVYNLRAGGFGGFDLINKNLTEEQKQKRSRVAGLKTGSYSFKGKKHTTETLSKMSKSQIGKPLTFLGKQHTPKTIALMRELAKGRGQGNKNSQHGTRWITNEVESKKIDKDSVIPEGWRAGRITNQRVVL